MRCTGYSNHTFPFKVELKNTYLSLSYYGSFFCFATGKESFLEWETLCWISQLQLTKISLTSKLISNDIQTTPQAYRSITINFFLRETKARQWTALPVGFNYRYLKFLKVFASKKKFSASNLKALFQLVIEIYQYWLLPFSCQKVDLIVFPEKCNLIKGYIKYHVACEWDFEWIGQREREPSMYWGP